MKKQRNYWTKEKVLEESKKYKTRGEFAQKSPSASRSAHKNGWFDEITHFEFKKHTNGYWTKEKVLEESKKYTNRVEFRNGSPTAYSLSKKFHWLDEMPWIKMLVKPNGYWSSKENVINKAKECNSITEFEKKHSAGYMSALRNGWVDEIKEYYEIWGIKFPRLYFIYVYTDIDNKVAYVGLTNDKEERHKTHLSGFYRGRKSRSQVYKYFTKIGKVIPSPTYLESGLSAKEASKCEKYWKEYYQNELGYTMLNKAECGNLGGGILKWTKEKVFEESKKYKTRTEFFKNCQGAYTTALQNKWLDEMSWFASPQKPHNYWCEETLMKECEKYNSMSEMTNACKSTRYAMTKFNLTEKVKQYFKEKNKR